MWNHLETQSLHNAMVTEALCKEELHWKAAAVMLNTDETTLGPVPDESLGYQSSAPYIFINETSSFIGNINGLFHSWYISSEKAKPHTEAWKQA